jgi:hypothetical protein
MAVAIPDNNSINLMFATRDRQRIRQLFELEVEIDSEDYRTVSTDRGPVRGYGGGRAPRL